MVFTWKQERETLEKFPKRKTVCTLQSRGWQKQKEFGGKRVKTETCFHCWCGCGAAEERETDCREEGERGYDQQEMPAAEGDAARVGEGGRLRVCTSSCGGGFMWSEGSCAAAPWPPWSQVQLPSVCAEKKCQQTPRKTRELSRT